MSSISVYLERLHLPSSSPRGQDQLTAPTSEFGYTWFEALSIPYPLLRGLAAQGLANVAWLRWLGCAITGAHDARVYLTSACREEDLVQPETPFPLARRPVQVTNYYIRVLRVAGQLTVPIHPKDASARYLTSRPLADPTPWDGLDRYELKELAVRDLNLCQLSGEPDYMGSHASHVIPRRRGNVMFDLIAEARSTSDEYGAASKLDSLDNLVTLSLIVHRLWSGNAFGLLPLPNVAHDSHGRPLPYDGAEAEVDAAKVFVSAQFPLDPAAVPSARRDRPVARFLYLPEGGRLPSALKGYTSGQHRLRGPFGTDEESDWPPEWVWSYRLASQLAVHYGRPALREELQRFWDAYEVDPRGRRSETGSSATVPSLVTTENSHDDEGRAVRHRRYRSDGRREERKWERDPEGDGDGRSSTDASSSEEESESSVDVGPAKRCKGWVRGVASALKDVSIDDQVAELGRESGDRVEEKGEGAEEKGEGERRSDSAGRENATTSKVSDTSKSTPESHDGPITRSRRQALGQATQAT